MGTWSAKDEGESAPPPDFPSDGAEWGRTRRWGKDRTVAVIDDEDIVRQTISVVLGRAGLRVLNAEDMPGALALCATCELKIDAFLIDCHLGGDDGVRLASQIRERRPEARILLMSGDPNVARLLGEPEPACCDKFLCKPFGVTELLQAVIPLLLP